MHRAWKRTAAIGFLWLLLGACLGQAVECYDPDLRDTVNRTQRTLRENMTQAGLYCDLTISWNVSKAMAMDPAPHQAALQMYKSIYAKVATQADTLDVDRNSGVNRDCLAVLYKILCAYNFPLCQKSTLVALPDTDVQGLQDELRPAQVQVSHGTSPVQNRLPKSERD